MIELASKIGNKFYSRKSGNYEMVILEEVRKDKVKLRGLGRTDSFLFSTNKFNKFFKEQTKA